MDPGTAEVYVRSTQINGVKSSPDPAPSFEDHDLHARVGQGVGYREAGDPRAHHDHPPHGICGSAGHFEGLVIEQCGARSVVPNG
jgi:hypothetical protein